MTDKICPDCGTKWIVACGPPGCIPVPACWCADDKRKAEARQRHAEATTDKPGPEPKAKGS